MDAEQIFKKGQVLLVGALGRVLARHRLLFHRLAVLDDGDGGRRLLLGLGGQQGVASLGGVGMLLAVAVLGGRRSDPD